MQSQTRRKQQSLHNLIFMNLINKNNNTFPINATLNKPFAQFNTDSTSSGGGVTLQGTKGSRRITVTTATGRVTIIQPGG